MSESTQGKRIGYIDIMKAIGIIFVIMGHYWAPSYIGFIIWSFHMPLFVVISGYFLKGNMDCHKLKKYCISYLIPYSLTWAVNALLFSMKNIYGGTFSWRWLANYVLSCFWALGSNATPFKPENITKVGVIWFLMALFWGEIIFCCILKAFQKGTIQIICIMIIWAVASIVASRICLPFGIMNGISFLPWLFLGNLFRRKKVALLYQKITQDKYMFFWLVLWCAVILVQVKYGWKFSIAELQLEKLLLGFLGAAAGISLVRRAAIKLESMGCGRILVKVGQGTLWILCVHGIGIELISPMISLWTGKMWTGCGVMLIRLAADIFIGLALKKVWHKIKGNGSYEFIKGSDQKNKFKCNRTYDEY